MSDREETFEDYDSYIEDNPYDVTSAAEHFQSEKNFVEALDKYRESRERNIWSYVATKYEAKIQELETQALENLAVYDKALDRVKELELKTRNDAVDAYLRAMRECNDRISELQSKLDQAEKQITGYDKVQADLIAKIQDLRTLIQEARDVILYAHGAINKESMQEHCAKWLEKTKELENEKN